MTRWKVLPRDQCQGMPHRNCRLSAADRVRYPKLHRELHHPAIQQRRKPPHRAYPSKQAQPRPRLRPEAGVAPQLANFHQRDYIIVP